MQTDQEAMRSPLTRGGVERDALSRGLRSEGCDNTAERGGARAGR